MTPATILLEFLKTRPQAARVALVVDSDRLLCDAGLLGKKEIVDPGGRAWQLAVYRGDDLAFRLRFRKALAAPPVAIVLTRGEGTTAPIDVSTIADVLGRNEGGAPLDLSFPSVLRRFAPKINFPAAEVRRHKEALLQHLPEMKDAAAKIIERWGKPDDWGRGQVAALVLLARHPELTLAAIWPDETEPADFVAHIVRLLTATPILAGDRDLVREMILEAARPQVRPHRFWLETDPEHLAAFLVLRRVAEGIGLQNPTTQLAGLQVFPAEMPLQRMDALALPVAERLRRDAKVWTAMEAAAERALPQRSLARLAALVQGGKSARDALIAVIRRPETPAALLHQLLTAYLTSFFAKPNHEVLFWTADLASHPLFGGPDDRLTPAASACRSALWLLRTIHSLEARLALALPSFGQAGELLDWFVASGTSRMELDLAEATHRLRETLSGEALEAGLRYLFGAGDELSPDSASLKGRIHERLDQLDRQLAGFVRADPVAFLKGSRSVLGFVHDEAAGAVSAEQRIWILLFDGMRLDLWDAVVAPLLAEHFRIEGRPRFAILPSFTGIARTSLFAGRLPGSWFNPDGNPTHSEPALLARSLGLASQQVAEKLRFLTEADTTKALSALGAKPADAGLVNVLVYPIADDCHEFRGDLAAFTARIRTDILGDRSRGVRGILDDLLARVRPSDTVLATSDHGFLELLSPDGVPVTSAETTKASRSLTEDVRFRYVTGFRPAAVPDALEIPGDGISYFVAVGRRWLRREGTKGIPRYEHGGLSLAEVAVPAAVLRRVTEKDARVELEGLPDHRLAVDEDGRLEIPVIIRNTGNVAVEFDLHVTTNLGEEALALAGTLQPGENLAARPAVLGCYRLTSSREPDPSGTLRAVTFRLRHTDLRGAWRDAREGATTVPILVKPKKTRLDTDALKAFDSI